MRLPSHPLFRPLLALGLFLLTMQVLKSSWKGKGGLGGVKKGKERRAVAHFMLGNTYPFTESDWRKTFHLAEETGLDGFALNLGAEDWQVTQLHTAYSVLAASEAKDRFKLFISIDANVQPVSTEEDGQIIIDKLLTVLNSDSNMRMNGRRLLSTFGGERAEFGSWGWTGFLERLNERLGEEVFFMPAFFLPPRDLLHMNYADGIYAWNSAWPMGDYAIDTSSDRPFLESPKPYMAAVSPLFSTHYGSTGDWPFDKNFIYRSDDLLYPSRWLQLLKLPAHLSPDIVQVISWNDYGESHNIAPIIGAQPGSEAWTKGMNHEAFREMTWYFVGRWKHAQPEVGSAVRIWMWYRTHPASMRAVEDEVGQPTNAEWAQDLINVVILAPETKKQLKFHITPGDRRQTKSVIPGQMNMFTIPFRPGSVSFEITKGDDDEVILGGEGRDIVEHSETYNFNMWSGSWRAKL